MATVKSYLESNSLVATEVSSIASILRCVTFIKSVLIKTNLELILSSAINSYAVLSLFSSVLKTFDKYYTFWKRTLTSLKFSIFCFFFLLKLIHCVSV